MFACGVFGLVWVCSCGVPWGWLVVGCVCLCVWAGVCVLWAGESVFVCFLWGVWVVACVLVSRGVRVGLLVVVLLVGGVCVGV